MSERVKKRPLLRQSKSRDGGKIGFSFLVVKGGEHSLSAADLLAACADALHSAHLRALRTGNDPATGEDRPKLAGGVQFERWRRGERGDQFLEKPNDPKSIVSKLMRTRIRRKGKYKVQTSIRPMTGTAFLSKEAAEGRLYLRIDGDMAKLLRDTLSRRLKEQMSGADIEFEPAKRTAKDAK